MVDKQQRSSFIRSAQVIGTLVWLLLASQTAVAREPTVLVLGDSLSAGYGIDLEQAWPTLLQQYLPAGRVINASISGETSAAGRQRLPTLLARYQPTIVILELGANDGLRGLSLEYLYDNLQAMVSLSQQRGARVLLLGMRIPPNYGRRYSEAFSACYQRLAEEKGLASVPFLLAGIAGDRDQMQADGLHPRAAAQEKIRDVVWLVLSKMLVATK